jgi:hypothetical protein
MSSKSEELIKKLGDRILTQTLVCQTIIDVLIEKGICTADEFDDVLSDNILDLEDRVVQNNELLNDVDIFLDDDEEADDLFTGGMFYGTVGEA